MPQTSSNEVGVTRMRPAAVTGLESTMVTDYSPIRRRRGPSRRVRARRLVSGGTAHGAIRQLHDFCVHSHARSSGSNRPSEERSGPFFSITC